MNKKIIYLALFPFLFWSCKKEEPKPQDGPKPFQVVSAEVKDITGYLSYPTNIQGIVNNDVRAKIQGYIKQVLVDEGQMVSQGQPLFRLETNVLSENADAAKSGITAAQANITAAQAAVNAAQVEVDKLKPLVQKNIISPIQLQTAQANVAKAQAQLLQTKAAYQQQIANYKSAAASVDYSIIRAPISGVVGKLPLKVGSLVGPTDQIPLTTLSNTSSVFAYFSMNEKDYLDFLEKMKGATVPEKIRNLPRVDLALANGSIYGEKGKIETVSGQIDPSTGTIQFRAGFGNPQKLLSNGNSGTIKLPIYYDQSIVIPESATYEQQGIVYAYKVGADNKVKNEIITVKDRVNNMVIVTSGINKGDRVVATGISALKPDMQIIPKPIRFDSLVQSIKPVF